MPESWFDPSGKGKIIALVVPNEEGSKSIDSYVSSVDFVEDFTGIDFFPQLVDDLEESLESSSDPGLWEFKPYTASGTSSTATQCKGIAKSTGVRCKNKTTNSIGYCYAHQSQALGYKQPVKTSYSGRCQAILLTSVLNCLIVRVNNGFSSGSIYVMFFFETEIIRKLIGKTEVNLVLPHLP